MAIFVYFSFPLSDARLFLPESNKLDRPSWTLIRSGSEFIRSFGEMGIIRHAGNPKWPGGEPISYASNALGFSPNFNKQKFGSQRCPFSVKCCNRRLLSDGKVAHRVDVGFRLKKMDQKQYIASKDIQMALNTLMNVEVTIQKRSKNKCKLFNAGDLLAKHYLKSSTQIKEKKLKNHENWWVSSGVPIIFLELDQNVKFGSLRGCYSESFKSRIAEINILYFKRLENNRKRDIALWVIEKSDKYREGRKYLRHIRRHILRLHSEWECMKNIYVLLNESKKIEKIPDSEEYKKLKSYIFDDTELLLKQEFDNMDQYESDYLNEAIDLLKKVNTKNIPLIMSMRESFTKGVSDKSGYILKENKKEKTVFISYNHKDREYAEKLKKALEAAQIPFKIDIEDLESGDDISDFISRSIKETDYTISIFSKNSLKSPWVVKESILTLNIQEVDKEKKFIPVHIDKSFLEIDAQSKIIDYIDEALKKIDDETQKNRERRAPTTNLDNKRSQLTDLRHHIDRVLKKLNESFSCDISSDTKFKRNLPRLIEQLKM